MTNYNKWANFDADRVLQEQERRDAIEETNLQRKIDNLKATQKITESLTQAQKDAEIMSSKVKVLQSVYWECLRAEFRYVECRRSFEGCKKVSTKTKCHNKYSACKVLHSQISMLLLLNPSFLVGGK